MLGRRRLQHERLLVELEQTHFRRRPRAVEEVPRRVLGRDQPRGGDVGRRHRARDVVGEHGCLVIDRHRDASLWPGRRHHEHDQGQAERSDRQMPSPTGTARRDRRDHRRGHESRRCARPSALVAHVPGDQQRDRDQRDQDDRRGEAHGVTEPAGAPATVASVVYESAPRSTVIGIESPGWSPWSAGSTSDGEDTGWLPIWMITSPGSIPARCAGPLGRDAVDDHAAARRHRNLDAEPRAPRARRGRGPAGSTDLGEAVDGARQDDRTQRDQQRHAAPLRAERRESLARAAKRRGDARGSRLARGIGRHVPARPGGRASLRSRSVRSGSVRSGLGARASVGASDCSIRCGPAGRGAARGAGSRTGVRGGGAGSAAVSPSAAAPTSARRLASSAAAASESRRQSPDQRCRGEVIAFAR